MSTSLVRRKTGEKCAVKGTYEFDGYLDNTSWPSPTAQESRIPLTAGETFPPVRSANKGCWWKLIQ